jgi:methyltransferase-like protein/cyclopropane fatty-acyl-phospholipid synthase-like methyltransferase
LNTYDEVYYPSHSFPQTHPDRLATAATLFGMNPARVDGCRYLELGCGDAGNLIPMAFYLPESEFVGIDLAARPIEMGRELARELGLKNLQLHQLSIDDIDEQFGEFDFVVAHGVYSWVPPQVRDSLLNVCSRHLSPHGVGYISYNTFPGGHLRRMIWDMMRFHVRGIEEPQRRISQAQALLSFVSSSKEKDDLYIEVLRKELERTARFNTSHLFHDDLAEINDPVYFHQFVDHAAQFGLRFLAEADYFEMKPNSFTAEAIATLDQLGDDIVRREQYSDFIKCRRFRQTLLCREDVIPERFNQSERVKNLFASSSLRPTAAVPDLDSRTLEEFVTENKSRISTDHPLLKNAFNHLGSKYPQVVSFEELLDAASLEQGKTKEVNSTAENASILAEALLESYGSDVVKLHSHRPGFITEVTDYPCANLLVRTQLKYGQTITNEHHRSIRMEDALGRALLTLLDGTRNLESLKNDLHAMVLNGEVPIEVEDENSATIDKLREIIDGHLEQSLSWLSMHGVLCS